LTNSSLLVRGSIDDFKVESKQPSEKGRIDSIWCLRYDIGRMLYASQCSGLTPDVGNIGSLPCKQDRSTKSINTYSIEQVPYTPLVLIEDQLLQWQAKATTDRRSIPQVGINVDSFAEIYIFSTYMGLRPQVLMLMFLVLSVARPPYASFHSRRRERITQLGRILLTGVNKERNAIRRPLYA
jgi:hypothetical protein